MGRLRRPRRRLEAAIDRLSHRRGGQSPEHIGSVLAEVAKRALAPRTVRHIYFTMHAMFRKAVPRLIDVSPCSIDTDDLPSKIDKAPEWRATAVFSKDELVAVLTAPKIPDDRRACYALLFLAGLRFGESAALRWRHYDPALKPLGRLVVAHSYNTKQKREGAVKTEQPRWVPVHDALVERLAEWRAIGWPQLMGRTPGPDDLIVPSRRGRNRSVNQMLKKFHQDLERIGLRTRRQHDARRTFISLALADGGRKDILRWITHGPEGDIVDLYTTLPWHTLCEEVARLKIDLAPPAESNVIALAKYANSREPHLHSTYTAENSKSNRDVSLRGGRDLKVRPPAGQAWTGADSGGQTPKNRGTAEAAVGPERPEVDSKCQSVSALLAPDRWSAPPCYCNGMSTLHARVRGGQIVVEGKTDLPEGTELTLVMVEAADEMTPEERADLEAELERGRAAIAAGRGISGDELLARVRES